MAIALRAQLQIAQHAAAAMEAIVAATATEVAIALLTRRAAEVAMVAEEVPLGAVVQGRAGRERVRLFSTRLLKFNHSHQFAKLLKREQQRNLTFAMFSCATLGMTDKDQPESFMIY
jgi:hypothetical protein